MTKKFYETDKIAVSKRAVELSFEIGTLSAVASPFFNRYNSTWINTIPT